MTYFAFLSFFPILALAFFVVGWIAQVYPDAQDDPRRRDQRACCPALDRRAARARSALDRRSRTPRTRSGCIGLRRRCCTPASAGCPAMRERARSWCSSCRRRSSPSFVVGKLRDLRHAGASSAWCCWSASRVAGLVGGFSRRRPRLDRRSARELRRWLVELLDRGASGSPPTWCCSSRCSGCSASPHAPDRSLWSGALLGAVAFEVLKQLSALLLAATRAARRSRPSGSR